MSLFGANRPAAQSTFGGGGLFGPPTTQQLQQQPGPFGLSTTNPLANSLAAQKAQQQQAPPLPTLSQSQAQLTASLWQSGRETPHQKPITNQIQEIIEKFEPNSPACVFRHYFYNRVNESDVPYYKPTAIDNPREWEEALQKKPAPGFIPVMCVGFMGLGDRLKTQKKAVAELNTRLHQINGGLDALLSRHDLQTSVRAAAARRKHVVLQQRCLRLAAQVQVVRNRGYALSGDEDDLRIKLRELETSAMDPAVAAKEEELWSRLLVIRGYADRLMQEMNKPTGQEEDKLDEDTEFRAKKLLEDYEKQLQHLKKEIESIKGDFESWEKDRSTGA